MSKCRVGAAILAVRLVKAYLSPADLREFKRLYGRSGKMFDRVLNARAPAYMAGGLVLPDDMLTTVNGLLTDRELEDYVLERDSTPLPQPLKDWEAAYDTAIDENRAVLTSSANGVEVPSSSR